jgi:hypothetical protein
VRRDRVALLPDPEDLPVSDLSTPRPEREDSVRAPADASIEPVVALGQGTSPREAAVLSLQRSAGNRATLAALRAGALGPRRPSRLDRSVIFAASNEPVHPPPVRKASSRQIQRDPIFTAITGGQAGNVAAPTPEEIAKLNIDVGTELRRLAGNAVNRAAEQFDRGCDAVKGDLEKAAKQQAELIALAVDIMAGFAAPGLAAVILTSRAAKASAIQKLLVDTGKINDLAAAGNAALDKLDVLEQIRTVGLDLSPSFIDKVSGDNLKATFTGASKIATQTIKTVGPAKLAGSSMGVLAALSAMVAAGAQDLDRSLASKSEEELFALILALDANVANANSYAAQIRAYLSQVVPIGATSTNEFGSGTKSLVKMNAYGGPRLAVVDSGMEGIIFGTPFYEFVSWISPSMEASALARAGLTLDQVPAFDPDKLSSLAAPLPGQSRILPLATQDRTRRGPLEL